MKSRRVYFLLFFILCATIVAIAYAWFWKREHRYDNIIFAAATRYEVSPDLIKAVVWRESRFRANAQGGAGERGLMQIRALAGKEWAQAEKIPTFDEHHLFDPGTNTLAGAWYLKKLLKRYRQTDNPLPYTLADYNAGRSNVLRWNNGEASTNSAAFVEQITFPGTKEYIRAVTRRYEHYQR